MSTAADLVARVRSTFPELIVASARLVEGHGQNSFILVVDERIVFRVPRHVAGRAALAGEVALLRRLRGRLPLATPDPTYVAEDMVGYTFISGEPLLQVALDRVKDASLGRQVGAFLRALHATPVDAAGFDPLAEWRDLYRRIEVRLFEHMRPDAREEVRRHFAGFVAVDIEPCLVHGDFGTANILWDPTTRRVTGVIDFGHAGVGDPAVDFAALPWSPAAFLEGLVAAYPAVRQADERVAFYRGTFALQEALFGLENGDEAAFHAGIAGFRP